MPSDIARIRRSGSDCPGVFAALASDAGMPSCRETPAVCCARLKSAIDVPSEMAALTSTE